MERIKALLADTDSAKVLEGLVELTNAAVERTPTSPLAFSSFSPLYSLYDFFYMHA